MQHRVNHAAIEERCTLVYELSLDGYTQRQISKELGIPQNTVSQDLKKAIAEIPPSERAEQRQIVLDRFNRWTKNTHSVLNTVIELPAKPDWESTLDNWETLSAVVARLISVGLAVEALRIKTFRLYDDEHFMLHLQNAEELEFEVAEAVRAAQEASAAEEAAILAETRGLPAAGS